ERDLLPGALPPAAVLRLARARARRLSRSRARGRRNACDSGLWGAHGTAAGGGRFRDRRFREAAAGRASMIRPEPARTLPRGRLPSTTTQILIGLALGILVGSVWPTVGVGVKPLADAFLRMIKMIIAPLIFSTLVVGIAGTGDLKAMGRIGLKAIVYFEI